MNKHAAITDKLLRDYLPPGVSVYRGHLRLHQDATPADHKRIKLAFCRTMRRWASRHGNVFECHAVQHITSPTECHWDTVAYSDAPKTALRSAVSAAWERAGGKRQSLVPLDPAEIGNQCKYQSKDVRPEIRRGTHYLPGKGLQFHWSTAGFWQGHKPADLWKECIAEWFPADEASNTRDTLLQPSTDPDMIPESPVVVAVRAANPGMDFGCKSVSLVLDAAEKTELLAEIDRRLAALPGRENANMRGILPTCQDEAISAEQLAKESCVMVDDAERFLRSDYGVARVDVERHQVQPPDAHGVIRPRHKFTDPYWYRPAPTG